MANKLQVNRAPVLTLWASVVAERLGHERATALTLGRAVAGLFAQSKGQRLGIYEPGGKGGAQRKVPSRAARVRDIEFMNRLIPTVRTADGVRAVVGGRPMDPQSVERYLKARFGENLGEARRTLQKLANAYEGEELSAQAYGLYERFRPTIPRGAKGWGAKGELDLDLIRSLIP